MNALILGLYLVVVFMVGYLSVLSLSPKLRTGIILGASLPLGFLANSVFYAALSLFVPSVSALYIVFIDLIILTALGLYNFKRNKKALSSTFQNITGENKFTLFEIFCFSTIALLLLSLFFMTLSTSFNQPDEFGYWGRAAKLVFELQNAKIISFGLGGLERYPLFLPISSAIIAQVIGNFYENFVKIINPLLVTSSCVFIYSFFRNFKLNRSESLLLIILYLTVGRIFTIMSVTLYADVIFAVFYGIAVSLFYLFTKNREKGLLILSGLFFVGTAWVKIEGTIISYVTMMSLLAIYYIPIRKTKPLRNNKKRLLQFFSPIIIFTATWNIYGILFPTEKSSWASGLFQNTGYWIRNFQTFYLNIVQRLTSVNYFTKFWIIYAVILILSFMALFRRAYLYFLLPVLITLGYLVASYAFVLSAHDGIIAHSFERYILHVVPLAIMLLGIIYINFKNKIISNLQEKTSQSKSLPND